MSGTLVEIKPDGTETKHEVKGNSIPIPTVQQLVGGYVERIKVRYEGKVRDCYLNEEGLLRRLDQNDKIRQLAVDYYKRPDVQIFAGTGVIWIPNPRRKKSENGG